MRIIAGKYKGKTLFSRRDRNTRPTGGKVREAVFNICGDAVIDAHVIDLFAGTGAFGIEALSRGAASAVFVDSDKHAVDTIRKNIAACRAEAAAEVLYWDIRRNLNCLRHTGRRFDLVFMDPPYNTGAIAPAINNLLGADALAPGAVLIIEHDKNESVPADNARLAVDEVRQYGKTLVTFMRSVVEAVNNP